MAKRNFPRHPVLRDWHLWTEVARSVTPLKANGEAFASGLDQEPLSLPASGSDQAKPVLPKKPVRERADPSPPFSLPQGWTIGSAASSHPLSGFMPKARDGMAKLARPGDMAQQPIEPKLRRKLMRGQIEIDGRIDLHGLHQDEAYTALLRFLTARAQRGDRTVLVITGKGLKKANAPATGSATIVQRGVLRSMLPIWLADPRLAPMIAGWGVSAPSHGGEGAYYVRLKRGAL